MSDWTKNLSSKLSGAKTMEYVIVLLACLTILIFLSPYLLGAICTDKENSEDFESSYNPKIDLLSIKENENFLRAFKRMSVSQFNEMIDSMRNIIYNDIVKFSDTCTDMNEPGEPGEKRMTLLCYDDTESMENTILTHMCDYIIDHLKIEFGINMNPYYVFTDFKVNFNLTEDILYPLTDSTLYTVHGVRYFTKAMLARLINQNIAVKNVLYTVFQSRGIEVIPDIDEHI
jgi:hypothetical protein